MDSKTNELLESINKSLIEINARFDTNDTFAESDKLFEKVENRVESARNKIQNAFDRIHDKVFNFNNILIAAYITLGTFPSDSPKLRLWTVVFPIFNLIYMIVLDIRQMEIHRFEAKELDWTPDQRAQYGKRINKQTLLSFLSFILSIGCLIYLIIELI